MSLSRNFPLYGFSDIVIPYLSKRKVSKYILNDDTSLNNNLLDGTLHNLIEKIDEISNHPDDEIREEYKKTCESIIGYVIRKYSYEDPVTNKKITTAGLYINKNQKISLDEMGEGVPQILGLILNLFLVENKIFIIEEIENDIHPSALKQLLTLIIKSSENNQFFISTHSHIVMTMLGAIKSNKVFQISINGKNSEIPKMNVSKAFELSTHEERRYALEELGYDFSDLGLWSGWLLLEESSAQVIIQYLIKWFFPNLVTRLKVVSAGGVTNIKKRFQSMNDLFLFVHLEPAYKNKAWIIVDGGDDEKEILKKLSDIYIKPDGSGWHEQNFSQFSQHNFESYYPDIFEEDTKNIIDHPNQREYKKTLLNKVKDWIDKNEDIAKTEFEKSASEVIDKLRRIEISLLN